MLFLIHLPVGIAVMSIDVLRSVTGKFTKIILEMRFSSKIRFNKMYRNSDNSKSNSYLVSTRA